MAPKDDKPEPFIKTDGVIAGMVATLVTHPLDVLKIRHQISPARCTTLHLANQLMKYEGLQAFYCGLTAGLLRQATYTATRLTMFSYLCHKYVRERKKAPDFDDKIIMGICAGLAGGLVGNPSEVVLVRRIAEGCPRCPPKGFTCCRCPSSAYTGTVDAFRSIICAEGFCGLMRGTSLTLLRSVVLSTVYVGSYTQFRDYVKDQTGEKDQFTLRVYTAVGLSFIGAILTLPIDIVKTFYQASRSDDIKQKEILRYLVHHRGVLGLWKGFTPYFTRMAIHTVVSFMVIDSLRNT